MWLHELLTQAEVRTKIRQQEIAFAGNHKLKIYGLLTCTSGKRMKKQNRVFFVSETEALKNGYRPCGNCTNKKYHQWIYSTKSR